MGPILDMFTISRDVAGTSCKDSERHVNMGLLHPFTVSARAHRFTSLVVTPLGYKAGDHPCVNLCPLV
jgi:hypothetical protein